jgi:hypothetical protein
MLVLGCIRVGRPMQLRAGLCIGFMAMQRAALRLMLPCLCRHFNEVAAALLCRELEPFVNEVVQRISKPDSL